MRDTKDGFGRPLPGRSTAARSALVASAACLFLPALAGAQEPQVLAPITVEGQSEDEALPGGVSVGPEAIERRNPTDLKDLLTGEPNVNVGGPNPISQKVYVQGMESTNLNVQIDGARKIEPSFHHVGTSMIDPSMLKSVRIEPGVAAADAGPGALGGAIAYETKDARDILSPGATIGGFGKLAYDTNTEGFAETGTLAALHDGFEALAYGMNMGGNSYEDGSGTIQRGTAPELLSGQAKLAYSALEGHRVELSGTYLEDVGIRPARPNFSSLNNALGGTINRLEYFENSVTASYVDETPSDLVDPQVSLGYTKTQLTLFGLQAGPVITDLGSDVTSINGKAANTFRFGDTRLTAGVDFYHDEATGTYGRRSTAPTGAASNTETATNVGVFTQLRLPLMSDLRLSIGGRADQQWFEGIDGSDFSNFGLGGNVNLQYDVLPSLMAYAGAGTAFGGIPIGETAIYDFSGIWNYAGLEPSQSRNYKGGLEFARDGFTAAASMFYNKIDDSHNLTSTRRADTQTLVTRGGSVSGGYDYGDGFVRATFSRTIVRLDGLPPVSTAAAFYGVLVGDVINLEAGHGFDDLGLRFGTSNEFVLRNDENSTGQSAGYVVVNLYGEWSPPAFDNLTLRVDARNVLDQTYVDRATAGYDNATVNPYNEPGRSFVLSARMTF